MEVRVFSTAPLPVKAGHCPFRSRNSGRSMGECRCLAVDSDDSDPNSHRQAQSDRRTIRRLFSADGEPNQKGWPGEDPRGGCPGRAAFAKRCDALKLGLVCDPRTIHSSTPVLRQQPRIRCPRFVPESSMPATGPRSVVGRYYQREGSKAFGSAGHQKGFWHRAPDW